MTFGDYLRQLRDDKSWTQPEAALKAGIEQSYLSKLETGKSIPSEDVFERLATAYGIAVDDLVAKLPTDELNRLQDIRCIRTALQQRDANAKGAKRFWLVSVLCCMMMGGACLGVTHLAKPNITSAYIYVSHGVLKPGEALDAFEKFRQDSESGAMPDESLLDRYELRERHLPQRAGNWFVETEEGGKRYFRYDGARTDHHALAFALVFRTRSGPFIWRSGLSVH